MEFELVNHCCDLDTVRKAREMNADVKTKKLWYAAYAMRSTDVPEMPDAHLESLTELSYLTTLPAFRYIAVQAYATVLQRLPKTYQTFFARMVKLAKHLKTHGAEELATDSDWEEWIESM